MKAWSHAPLLQMIPSYFPHTLHQMRNQQREGRAQLNKEGKQDRLVAEEPLWDLRTRVFDLVMRYHEGYRSRNSSGATADIDMEWIAIMFSGMPDRETLEPLLCTLEHIFGHLTLAGCYLEVMGLQAPNGQKCVDWDPERLPREIWQRFGEEERAA